MLIWLDGEGEGGNESVNQVEVTKLSYDVTTMIECAYHLSGGSERQKAATGALPYPISLLPFASRQMDG